MYLVLQNSFDLIRPLRLDHKGGEPRMETRVEYRRRLADMPLDDILPGFNSQIRGPDGGETVSGSLVEAPLASTERLLPIGLCHGAKVVRTVAEDQTLSYGDVDMPEGGFARHLRALQEQALALPARLTKQTSLSL